MAFEFRGAFFKFEFGPIEVGLVVFEPVARVGAGGGVGQTLAPASGYAWQSAAGLSQLRSRAAYNSDVAGARAACVLAEHLISPAQGGLKLKETAAIKPTTVKIEGGHMRRECGAGSGLADCGEELCRS